LKKRKKKEKKEEEEILGVLKDFFKITCIFK